jgi:hypothetical protein
LNTTSSLVANEEHTTLASHCHCAYLYPSDPDRYVSSDQLSRKIDQWLLINLQFFDSFGPFWK